VLHFRNRELASQEGCWVPVLPDNGRNREVTAERKCDSRVARGAIITKRLAPQNGGPIAGRARRWVKRCLRWRNRGRAYCHNMGCRNMGTFGMELDQPCGRPLKALTGHYGCVSGSKVKQGRAELWTMMVPAWLRLAIIAPACKSLARKLTIARNLLHKS
jgi:hypothetical protein